MYNFYLDYLRSNNPDDVISKAGVKIRQFINPLFIKLLPLTGPYKYKIDRKAKMPKDRPIIYAPTHGFKDDLLYTLITIQDHAYILFGSLPQFYNTVDGLGAWIVGSIVVDRTNKESRASSKIKMQKAVEYGSNLLIYPEGAWNTTPNLLVEKLFPGIYDTAVQTDAVIAPVSTLVEGDTCYSILGEAFDISKYNRVEGMKVLRDKMATLKWELMEKHSITTREKLIDNSITPEEQWKNYVDFLISQVDYYDREMEKHANFKDKSEIREQEVYEPLEKLEITNENALVLSKIKRLR